MAKIWRWRHRIWKDESHREYMLIEDRDTTSKVEQEIARSLRKDEATKDTGKK